VKFLLSISFIFSLITISAQTDPIAIGFEPMGGVYTKNVTVTLTSESNSTIYYTLDGAIPGSHSHRYSTPINIDKIGIIRAVTYVNGKKSSVITQSYFCDRAYSLPIVSITSNPNNFWDYDRGIYVKGCCADTIEPYLGANFWKDWERTCNVEMYDTNGDPCFNQEAGMSLFGGFSRALPQKSIALIARKSMVNLNLSINYLTNEKVKNISLLFYVIQVVIF